MGDGLDALRERFAAAPMAEAAAYLTAACALIVGLVEELEDDEASDVEHAVLARIKNPRGQLAFRRQLARGLEGIGALDRVIIQLRACLELADGLGDADLTGEVGAALDTVAARHAGRVAPRVRDERVLSAAEVDDPEVAAGLELALARQTSGDVAIAHARQALTYAYDAVDQQLAADATSVLAELLVAKDELAEAKQLIEQRPLLGDGRVDKALYDEIRRRLGEYVPDPPDEPDELVHGNPAILEYVTRSPNPARSVGGGGLPAAFKIREWSSGTLTEAAELESQRVFGPVRSFWCACGRLRGREYANLVCPRCGVEIVHCSTRRIRTAAIELPTPLIHPWHVGTASVLLDVAEDRIRAMPLDALRTRLDAVELDLLAARFKQDIVTAPKMKVADQAGRKLAIVDAFRNATATYGTEPSSIILDVILVVPPVADLGLDRDKVRAAYARLLDDGGSVDAVHGLFAAFSARA